MRPKIADLFVAAMDRILELLDMLLHRDESSGARAVEKINRDGGRACGRIDRGDGLLQRIDPPAQFVDHRFSLFRKIVIHPGHRHLFDGAEPILELHEPSARLIRGIAGAIANVLDAAPADLPLGRPHPLKPPFGRHDSLHEP